MSNNKWFTLVEMLIVVVIIGILSAALIPRLTGAQGQARDAARTSNLWQIGTALSIYHSDRSIYPIASWSTDEIIGDIVPKYMDSIPGDPQSERNSDAFLNGISWTWWLYTYTSMKNKGVSNAWYVLWANMETDWTGPNWHITDTYDNSNLNAEATASGINASASESQRIMDSLCDEVLFEEGGTDAHVSKWKCIEDNQNDIYYLMVK